MFSLALQAIICPVCHDLPCATFFPSDSRTRWIWIFIYLYEWRKKKLSTHLIAFRLLNKLKISFLASVPESKVKPFNAIRALKYLYTIFQKFSTHKVNILYEMCANCKLLNVFLIFGLVFVFVFIAWWVNAINYDPHSQIFPQRFQWEQKITKRIKSVWTNESNGNTKDTKWYERSFLQFMPLVKLKIVYFVDRWSLSCWCIQKPFNKSTIEYNKRKPSSINRILEENEKTNNH